MSGKPQCPYCRFFSKIRRENGCWRWTGTHDENGYGYIHARWDTNKGKGYPVQAHRFAWAYLVGLIPEGKHVYHYSCDHRDCVRPDHCRVGTPSDYIPDWRAEWKRRGSGHRIMKAKEYLQRAAGCLGLIFMVSFAYADYSAFFSTMTDLSKTSITLSTTTAALGATSSTLSTKVATLGSNVTTLGANVSSLGIQLSTMSVTLSSFSANLGVSLSSFSASLGMLSSMTQKLINISSYTYVMGFAHGMGYERCVDLNFMSGFGLMCSSPTFFNLSISSPTVPEVNIDSTTCGQVLRFTQNYILMQSSGSVVVPGL